MFGAAGAVCAASCLQKSYVFHSGPTSRIESVSSDDGQAKAKRASAGKALWRGVARCLSNTGMKAAEKTLNTHHRLQHPSDTSTKS